MSLTTIRTRYDNTKCRLCKTVIPYNGLCRYSNRIKGVACMECEPERTGTPANGAPVTTPTSAADPQLQASLADGRMLRARVGEMEADIARMNAAAREAEATIQMLRDRLTMSEEVRLKLAAHMLTLPTVTPAIDDGSDLINVMAPGGVERWLEHDLAQIAAERAMKERQAIPVIADDDCPI